MYIQLVVTRNKFISFRPSKLVTLTFLTVKENVYTNLQRTIISSLVNKNFNYIIILFLCYVFSFVFKYFFISLPTLEYSWILNQNVFFPKRKKFPKNFQSILRRMNKYNLFLSTNVLSFDVLTILIHHFVLFFRILSQTKKINVKRNSSTQSSCMIFFPYFMSNGHIFQTRYLFKVLSQWI